MSYDVFISYASKDKTAADAVCARLEAAGIRCWIAPRDITPGTSYGEAIIEAIHGLKVMVLVFSSHANLSAHIPKEVERAVSSGVAIIPFRIEDVAPGKSLDYFIGSVHWLDAMTPPLEQHLDSSGGDRSQAFSRKIGRSRNARRRRRCVATECASRFTFACGIRARGSPNTWKWPRVLFELNLDWRGRGSCYRCDRAGRDYDARRREYTKYGKYPAAGPR